MPIKILDFIPANYESSDEIKIYLSNGRYDNYAVAYGEFWYISKDTLLDLVYDTQMGLDIDLIVNPRTTVGLYVLTNNHALLSKDSSFYKHDKFHLSEFNKAQTYQGDIYYSEAKPLWWNGDIIYSLLKKEFEYKCKVDGDKMKLNGIKFKRD